MRIGGRSLGQGDNQGKVFTWKESIPPSVKNVSLFDYKTKCLVGSTAIISK